MTRRPGSDSSIHMPASQCSIENSGGWKSASQRSRMIRANGRWPWLSQSDQNSSIQGPRRSET